MQIICRSLLEWHVARQQLEKHGYKWLSGHKPTQLYKNVNRMFLTLNQKGKTITIGKKEKDAVEASVLYANLLR